MSNEIASSSLSLEGIASLPFFAVLKYLGLLDVLPLYYVCKNLNKSIKQFAKENTPQSVAFVNLFTTLVKIHNNNLGRGMSHVPNFLGSISRVMGRIFKATQFGALDVIKNLLHPSRVIIHRVLVCMIIQDYWIRLIEVATRYDHPHIALFFVNQRILHYEFIMQDLIRYRRDYEVFLDSFKKLCLFLLPRGQHKLVKIICKKLNFKKQDILEAYDRFDLEPKIYIKFQKYLDRKPGIEI